MVQLFYHENRGKNCKKIFKHDGYPSKIHLHPYEGWGQPSSTTYWMLKTPWWSLKRCKVVEVSGTQTFIGKGKMTDIGNGAMIISGKIKGNSSSGRYFKLLLTSAVSNEDFQLGYSMTGTLERSNEKRGQKNLTHFVTIKRKGY